MKTYEIGGIVAVTVIICHNTRVYTGSISWTIAHHRQQSQVYFLFKIVLTVPGIKVDTLYGAASVYIDELKVEED